MIELDKDTRIGLAMLALFILGVITAICFHVGRVRDHRRQDGSCDCQTCNPGYH